MGGRVNHHVNLKNKTIGIFWRVETKAYTYMIFWGEGVSSQGQKKDKYENNQLLGSGEVSTLKTRPELMNQ